MSHNFPGNPWADASSSVTRNTAGVIAALNLLSYEQRTANLLAYLDYVTRMGMTGDALTEPYVEVLRRLGLNVQEATS